MNEEELLNRFKMCFNNTSTKIYKSEYSIAIVSIIHTLHDGQYFVTKIDDESVHTDIVDGNDLDEHLDLFDLVYDGSANGE